MPELAALACVQCGFVFTPGRRDQKYCSSNCRKSAYQKKDRAKNPKNSKLSPTTRYDNALLFDTAMRMSETLYQLRPDQRLGYIKELIDDARSGVMRIRKVLCNKYLLFAGWETRRLFFRRSMAYPNITQVANIYCHKYWNSGVVDVVYGKVPEPETGELCCQIDAQHTAICNGDAKSVVSITIMGFLAADIGSPNADQDEALDGYLKTLSETQDKSAAYELAA